MASEAPNTLVSNARIKILDLITEGPSPVFWPQSGISGLNPMCSIYFDGVPLLNGDGSPNYNISGQGFSFGFKSGWLLFGFRPRNWHFYFTKLDSKPAVRVYVGPFEIEFFRVKP